MAAARARLWSSFRWRSESPLFMYPKQFSLASSAAADFFPDSLLASTEARASAPRPARPGGGADKPFGLVSATQHRSSVWESLRFALRTPVAVLSSVAPKLPPAATRSLHPQRVFLVCGDLSSFTAPSHWCGSHPYSFVSVISFFFCPTQVCGEFLAFWGV